MVYVGSAVSVPADAASCVLADHSWSGLSGPDTDADATHSQGPPGQDLCNALGERLQVCVVLQTQLYTSMSSEQERKYTSWSDLCFYCVFFV